MADPRAVHTSLDTKAIASSSLILTHCKRSASSMPSHSQIHKMKMHKIQDLWTTCIHCYWLCQSASFRHFAAFRPLNIPQISHSYLTWWSLQCGSSPRAVKETYFCSTARAMPVDSIDPSLAIGFYCRNIGIASLSIFPLPAHLTSLSCSATSWDKRSGHGFYFFV